MSTSAKNTSGGDRKRARAARRDLPARKALEGNHIRVRGKRLDQVNEDKIALAFWLLAKRLVSDETDEPQKESK